MKNLLTLLLCIIIMLCSIFSFVACDSEGMSESPEQTSTDNQGSEAATPSVTPVSTPAPTPKPIISEAEVDLLAEQWVTTEIHFESTKEYENSSTLDMAQFYVILDVVFTNKITGTSLTVPAFWLENNTFAVRFAPTEYGIWEYKTICETDESLNNITGTIGVNEYSGDLEIYKHGFVNVEEGKKYFVYADGTPFFYLGDTHWTMLTEEYDESGPRAGEIQTDSHFKYIVDKRVEQGFTVYQSEPLGHLWNINDCRFSEKDALAFAKNDDYFKYIAEKGLVHTNAMLVFASEISKEFADNKEFMELCCRMWVARYGSYPVMWTLAQECDNDYYYSESKSHWFNYETNPWLEIAEYLHKYDAYSHPLSGHQENTDNVTVTGAGTNPLNATNSGKSLFLSDEVTEKTGHNWWAAQWAPALAKKKATDSIKAKDYWNSPKVSVNYEGRYCYLWTKDYGSRVQGWFAYLNGFFGYGYGVADIWFYKSSYSMDGTNDDGADLITPEDKKMIWSDAINLPSATHLGIMKDFFEDIEWWNLVPDFFDENYFKGYSSTTNYACATIGNDLYVICLANKKEKYSGMVCGMDENATYTAKWFDPRTGEYILIDENIKADTVDKNGKAAYMLPNKPNNDTEDWVVIIKKN